MCKYSEVKLQFQDVKIDKNFESKVVASFHNSGMLDC